MKDYRKIIKATDTKYVRQLSERIKKLQEAGSYPHSFDMPVTLQFELLAECNLYCKHCYNGSGEHKPTLMQLEDWKRLANHIVECGGIFQCILSGGEPLLMGDGLFDIMDILHNDGTSFVIITNGFLLNKEKVNRLSKYRYYWFQVSIDGDSAEFHDDFRQVKGSWERAVNGAFEVSMKGMPLVIAHTVTPQTLPRLSQMARLAYSLGASTLMIGQVLPSGRANKYSEEILLSIDEENQMHDMIQKLVAEYHGKMEIQRASGIKTQFDRYKVGPNVGCIIRPNGDVRLDCMAPFVMGNVLKESFHDMWLARGNNIWNDPRVIEFINSVDEDKQYGSIRNYVDDDIILGGE